MISNEKIPYEELPITNNFMFCKVLSNEEVCKEFLETMLHIKISRLTNCNAEFSQQADASAKSVRYDVYAEDSENSFDIEMQMTDTQELALRARYYQAVTDVEQLGTGKTYATLKRSYVIFICPFDLYEKNLPKYTFESLCVEDKDVKMGDMRTAIFYNFNAPDELCDKFLDKKERSVLKYFKDGAPTTSLTKKMQTLLHEARGSQMWRKQFMTVAQMLIEERYYAEQRVRKEDAAHYQPIIDKQADRINQQSEENRRQAEEIEKLKARIALLQGCNL